MMIKHL
jgi:hypothetical protein